MELERKQESGIRDFISGRTHSSFDVLGSTRFAGVFKAVRKEEAMTISVAGGNAISWNIVNKNVSPGVSLKQKLARKVAVLAKHLIHFPPETLHLQVVLAKLMKKECYTVSLILRIPSNILHAEKSSHDLFEAIDSAVAAVNCFR